MSGKSQGALNIFHNDETGGNDSNSTRLRPMVERLNVLYLHKMYA